MRILYVIRPILNCTLYLTGSQWSFFSWGVMWENLEERVTTLQSEFWTSCNLLNSKSVSDKKVYQVIINSLLSTSLLCCITTSMHLNRVYLHKSKPIPANRQSIEFGWSASFIHRFISSGAMTSITVTSVIFTVKNVYCKTYMKAEKPSFNINIRLQSDLLYRARKSVICLSK